MKKKYQVYQVFQNLEQGTEFTETYFQTLTEKPLTKDEYDYVSFKLQELAENLLKYRKK